MKKIFSFLFCCLFIFGGLVETISAWGKEHFVMCAVFYDDDDAIKKFMHDALMYKCFCKHGADSSQYFDDKTPNPLASKGFNTINSKCGMDEPYTLYVKFIPIDSRKLKTMNPAELGRLKQMVKMCLSVVVHFDIADPRIAMFKKVPEYEELVEYHNIDWTLNDVIKLMEPTRIPKDGEIGYTAALETYAYNISKLSSEQYDDRRERMINFFNIETQIYHLDNQWGCRSHNENVGVSFWMLCRSHYFWGGSSTRILEPQVKKYLKITKTPSGYFAGAGDIPSSSSSSNSSITFSLPSEIEDEKPEYDPIMEVKKRQEKLDAELAQKLQAEENEKAEFDPKKAKKKKGAGSKFCAIC